MRIRDVMSRDVKTIHPDRTIQEAARMMAALDAGVVPVGEDDRLVGMITDRDIAIRAVALGRTPVTPVRQAMSAEVKYCFEDEDVDEVVANMADIKVRRLPVLNREKRLIGIVSLGDIAVTDGHADSGMALRGISEPGGAHSQSRDGAGMRAPGA